MYKIYNLHNILFFKIVVISYYLHISINYCDSEHLVKGLEHTHTGFLNSAISVSQIMQ